MFSPKSTGLALAALALTAAGALPARAWGPNGHAIVADIAQDRLVPQAQREVTDLLGLEEHQSLDQVASWPDTIGHVAKAKGGAPETLLWHYVDIDVTAPAYDAARDCPEGNCVTVRLPEMIRVLADHKAPQASRLVALKWIVHLVGDLHQPLHASERDHDKGGNGVKVSYFGDTEGNRLNLHSLWDEKIIEHETGLKVGAHYTINYDAARAEAKILDGEITTAQAAAWAPAGLLSSLDNTVIGWTNESHALARDVVYADVAKPAPDAGPDAIGDAYEKTAWPVIDIRLKQAGVRLAEILNEALGGAH